MRGLALITIFINHVPGQIFENLTTKNFGFSDAAEGFVLISGIAVGLAYGSRFQPGAWLQTATKATKRAFTLYLAHMITTFMTLALFLPAHGSSIGPGLLCEINILAVLTNLKAGIPSLLLLGHQIGYNNILPMYGALMLMVPIILLLNAASPLLAPRRFGHCLAVCRRLRDCSAQHADRRLLVPQSVVLAVPLYDRHRRNDACAPRRQTAAAPNSFCARGCLYRVVLCLGCRSALELRNRTDIASGCRPY